MKVQVIRTNGTTELHEIRVKGGRARIRECHKLAGCETFDTVNLRDGRVMYVDDNSYETDKPTNERATKLYHSICKPGVTHQIVGDVLIIKEEEWDAH